MENIKIRKLLKLNHIIPAFSCAYIGILFTGRSDILTWIFVTIAVLAAKVAQISFCKIFDKQNKKSLRYTERMIPEGSTGPVKLWFSGIISSGILIGSAFFLNQLCYFISISAAGLFLIVPLVKRFTTLPDYYFGIFEPVSLAGGFIAANGRYEYMAVLLAASVFFWTYGIELSLSIYEIARDKEYKIFSIPVKIGSSKTYIILLIIFILSVSGFIFSGIFDKRGLAYWIGLLCGAIILLRQFYLIKSKDAETAKKEFLQINNLFAPVIFLGSIIDIFFN
jgi:4-hydroxybenzoate polyprenyltransferase